MPRLAFKGRTFVENYHLAVPYHTLDPDPERSLTDRVRLDDNLIIRGDNLIALKALMPTYSGRVRCIFIDPPYNTGAESWVYNDNVNSPMMRDWIGQVVDGNDLTRHDKWLCMMMPRMRLLKELLADDGAIFVCCDDNEHHHLQMLMDEVFGESNFVANVVWKHTEQSRNNEPYFSRQHNSLLAYRKTVKLEPLRFERTATDNRAYANQDNDPKGPWRSGDVRNPDDRPTLKYQVHTPSGKVIEPPDNGWRWSPETLANKLESGEAFYADEETRIVRKIYLSAQKGRTPENLWGTDVAGSTREATRTLQELFGGASPFDTPKPVKLVRRVLDLMLSGTSNATVLDSFAGSGTTAQAVLEYNRDNGTDHRFILVELEDYADTVTAERVRRVIQGADGRAPVAGSLSYFTLGRPIDAESLLSGDALPPYEELARYLFYVATGEQFTPDLVDPDRGFIGQSRQYDVYLIYAPDTEALKSMSLDLDFAKRLGEAEGRRRLVFAPSKFLSDPYLEKYHIDFAQLPYELYRSR